MAKTLVCIISEDPIVNYLFAKEMYRRGDKLMLIAEQDYEEELERVAPLFPVPMAQVQKLVLRREYDDEIWGEMCRSIRGALHAETEYAVNLAGGSRFMALAVQQVFEAFKSKFYYVPETRNLVIHSLIDNLDNNDDEFQPMNCKISVMEYLKLYGLNPKKKIVTQSEGYTNGFFDLFVKQELSKKDYHRLDGLRCYRDDKRLKIDWVEQKEYEEKRPDIPGLRQFLDDIKFKTANDGELNRWEMAYLTGGWFEEYVYFKIIRDLRPDSIELGVTIQRHPSPTPNDLDVVFTLGNKLFVVECKTGVEKAAMFHQIAYKACALHESMLGVSSHSYIFSLSNDYNDNMTKMARNMDIVYCDRDFFLKDKEWQRFVADVKDKAFG